MSAPASKPVLACFGMVAPVKAPELLVSTLEHVLRRFGSPDG